MFRCMSLLFTVVYTLSILFSISSNFIMLMVSRVMMGVATSLLCTTFESWYLHQHLNTHKLPVSWINITFSRSTFYNGVLAIIAGHYICIQD